MPKYAAKFQARVPFEIVGDEEAEVNGPKTLRHSLNASVFHLRLPRDGEAEVNVPKSLQHVLTATCQNPSRSFRLVSHLRWPEQRG